MMWKKDRLYILLLIFIVLLNILLAMTDRASQKDKGEGIQKTAIAKKAPLSAEEVAVKRHELEKKFYENRSLATIVGLSSLLIILIILLGLVIDAILVSSRLSGQDIQISTFKGASVNWNLWDVAKVAILFLFFGYMIILIESALVRTFPILKNNNFRMIVNSSVLDSLGVVFILYFTAGQYKERLISLGISFKNFFKNVFYGIVGYVAAVPILIALLALTVFVTNLIKYVPEPQVVVELFMKEKDTGFLIFTSVFAAVIGPIIEELFFRGFMYNALKKYASVFWSMVATSAVFAALHAHIVGFLPILALGVLLAYLYEKTGTLVSSMTVHVMHNLAMVYLVFLAKQLSA